MATVNLSIKTYKQEGDLAHEYNPLRNLITDKGEIKPFNTDELDIDLNNPLNIECQPSYDGTVNLIINDDKNPPRIINTRFSKTKDNTYRIINRNQLEQTNLYKIGMIDRQTRLFRTINNIPKIDLLRIHNMGQMKGGNYTFYLKFADNDYNKTDIVAESGQVSIFKGKLSNIGSISGTLLDEITDKAVTLRITNVDTSFSKVYVYYTRETSDLNGIRLTKAEMLVKPYEIQNDTLDITINGFEETKEISPEEINIKYNVATAVKTQAQVQNMLFFGNVQETNINVKDLQNISYYIEVSVQQDVSIVTKGGDNKSVGWVSQEDYSTKFEDDVDQTEYYNPINIYYKLGYWPEEMYRLGVVYIMNDDTLSPVFNLRGCRLINLGSQNYKYGGYSSDKLVSLYQLKDGKKVMNYLDRDEFITGGINLENTFGVFRNPDLKVIDYEHKQVNPVYYKFNFNQDIIDALRENKVKGFFIVRQKRIPTVIAQGLSVGIDRTSYVPMLFDNSDEENQFYFTESFLDKSCSLITDFNGHKISTTKRHGSGLLCADANIIPSVQSLFDGSEFILKPTGEDEGKLQKVSNQQRHFTVDQIGTGNNYRYITANTTYIPSNSPLVYYNGYGFSTKCGTQEDVSQFSYFDTKDGKATNQKLIRGHYCPFLGVNANLQNNTIYTIKIPNYSDALLKEYFRIRGNDRSEFFAVSNRYSLDEIETMKELNVYRGDCYTNTITIRLNRNFIDSEVPICETIIDANTWSKNYKGSGNMVNGKEENVDEKKGGWTNINRADINTVPLGMWVTFKVLSNYNLGLRSEDRSHNDEHALMGSVRGFYPIHDISTNVSRKIEESWLLNDGYDATVGHRRNYIVDNVPYIKDMFDNRIMFSNVQREDAFQNAYRIFQGLSFEDIDRQYGAIVKLLPWQSGQQTCLLGIFEHGIGVIPVNEKALLSTTTGQSIHLYGADVLQSQIGLITPDFGSTWQESIIETPIAVYGVDTYAKKIWRVHKAGENAGSFETISDMKVQSFLNDQIELYERDKYPIIAIKNVKSHYNNFKGDVMFTFYNDAKGVTWNLCYNERLDKWITRYSWTPLYSENINNIFYSLDQDRAKVLGHIYDNKNCTYGLRTLPEDSESSNLKTSYPFTIRTELVGYKLTDYRQLRITKIETSFLNAIDDDIKVDTSDPNHPEYKGLLDLFSYSGTTITSKGYSDFERFFKSETIGATHVPVYYNITVEAGMDVTDDNRNDINSTITDVIGIINEYNITEKLKDTYLRNGFYVHGRAGIFNELNYKDASFDNQILPSKWYNRQEPFEFEFVVNGETGAHKIFDNLVIIANNVQPHEIEYEITGDVYKFNKAGIYRSKEFGEDEFKREYNKPKVLKYSDVRSLEGTGLAKDDIKNGKYYQTSQNFIKVPHIENDGRITEKDNCTVEWDYVLNSYTLKSSQSCKNIEEWGRRLGNIHYKEDSWYVTIDPILYEEKFAINGKEVQDDTYEALKKKYPHKYVKQVKIRDKFMKVRVKYTGEDIVIITALKTLVTPSYS